MFCQVISNSIFIFSALKALLDIAPSSYNFISIFLKTWFKQKVYFFNQILLYNHRKLWCQEFVFMFKSLNACK